MELPEPAFYTIARLGAVGPAVFGELVLPVYLHRFRTPTQDVDCGGGVASASGLEERLFALVADSSMALTGGRMG